MANQDQDRAAELALRASSLDPKSRSAFLDEHCGDDQALRQTVQAQLQDSMDSGCGVLWQSTSLVGQTLGQYRIESELGSGGMGVVYRAFDTRLQRPVAIKLFRNQIMEEREHRERVLAEARAASPLNHHAIATIYEVWEEGETLIIVMELVSGKTLREVSRDETLGSETIARIGSQVAEALATAHAQGVLHGDVKPENIMVREDGSIKLLDFGVARQLASETAILTSRGEKSSWLPEGHVAGTIAYMAPEQLRGEPPDARSDLFALGIVLYELEAGHRPFLGATPQAVMLQILNDQEPRLAGLKESVPPEFNRVVHRLLEKAPKDRYQSSNEVRVDLDLLVRDMELGSGVVPAMAGRRSVAVLPFKLTSSQGDQDFLRVALADAVRNELSAKDELVLRPLDTVKRFDRESVDPILAAREINADIVIRGNIQCHDQKLRVHLQAWDVRDGSNLLSAKVDGKLSDLFEFQDRIAERLVRGLELGDASSEPQPPPTANPRVYELYLRALERQSRQNQWDLRSAIEMLKEATTIDPDFADAWAHLAADCLGMCLYYEPEPHWFEKCEQALHRALDLDPTHCEALVVHGRVLWSPTRGFQHRAGLRAMSKALRINPMSHQGLLWQSSILFHVGLHEESKLRVTEANAVAPNDPMTLFLLSQAYWVNGELDEVKKYEARVRALDPASKWMSLFGPVINLYTGNLDIAEDGIRSANEIHGGDSLLSAAEALLWAKRGDEKRTLEATARSKSGARSLTHTHHAWHANAAAFATIERYDEAVNMLREASRDGMPNYVWFRDDPHFAGLKEHEPYLQLLSELKTEWLSYRQEFGSP